MYLKAPTKWGGAEPGSCQEAEITDKTLVRSVPGSKAIGIVLTAWSEVNEEKNGCKVEDSLRCKEALGEACFRKSEAS